MREEWISVVLVAIIITTIIFVMIIIGFDIIFIFIIIIIMILIKGSREEWVSAVLARWSQPPSVRRFFFSSFLKIMIMNGYDHDHADHADHDHDDNLQK